MQNKHTYNTNEIIELKLFTIPLVYKANTSLDRQGWPLFRI